MELLVKIELLPTDKEYAVKEIRKLHPQRVIDSDADSIIFIDYRSNIVDMTKILALKGVIKPNSFKASFIYYSDVDDIINQLSEIERFEL